MGHRNGRLGHHAGVKCAAGGLLRRRARARANIWAKSSTGGWFGADRAGKFGRSSEDIGRFVATTFLEDVHSGATVDRHLADQLVLFCALARGRSGYIVPRHSPHLDSNLWLVAQFGAHVAMEARRVEIHGLALTR